MVGDTAENLCHGAFADPFIQVVDDLGTAIRRASAWWLGLSVDRRAVPLLCGERAPLASWPR